MRASKDLLPAPRVRPLQAPEASRSLSFALDAGSTRYIAPGGESIYDNAGSWICARHELDSENNYATVLFINDLYWVNGWPSYTDSSGHSKAMVMRGTRLVPAG